MLHFYLFCAFFCLFPICTLFVKSPHGLSQPFSYNQCLEKGANGLITLPKCICCIQCLDATDLEEALTIAEWCENAGMALQRECLSTCASTCSSEGSPRRSVSVLEGLSRTTDRLSYEMCVRISLTFWSCNCNCDWGCQLRSPQQPVWSLSWAIFSSGVLTSTEPSSGPGHIFCP